MEEIREMLTSLLEQPDKRNEFIDLAMKMLNVVKRYDEDMFNCLVLKLHVKLYGYHFSEHMAKHAVHAMKNYDGTTGEYWTIEQTTNLLNQQGLRINKYDWYYVLNMLHSDAGEVFRSDTNLYIKYAMAVYFKDVDSDDSKVFKHYVAQKYCLY